MNSGSFSILKMFLLIMTINSYFPNLKKFDLSCTNLKFLSRASINKMSYSYNNRANDELAIIRKNASSSFTNNVCPSKFSKNIISEKKPTGLSEIGSDVQGSDS